MLFTFFFNDPATTEIYTSFPTRRSSDLTSLSLRVRSLTVAVRWLYCVAKLGCGLDPSFGTRRRWGCAGGRRRGADRKSTRLNSSHSQISYAVFCLKKKNDNSEMCPHSSN